MALGFCVWDMWRVLGLQWMVIWVEADRPSGGGLWDSMRFAAVKSELRSGVISAKPTKWRSQPRRYPRN